MQEPWGSLLAGLVVGTVAVLTVVMLWSLIASRWLLRCRGCADVIPERSRRGRCWRCGLPYLPDADLGRFQDGCELERPADEGRIRKDVRDITGDL
jgi:hypothetical protein